MEMDTVFGIIVGVSLAAACGFRVFIPMLVMSVGVKAGLLEVGEGWNWIGSWPALIAFSVATGIEVCGYYVPWIDNALDTLATPAAVVAGTIAAAACITDMHPLAQWSTAMIAGGGAAGIVQGTTVVSRGASSVTTGGFGNFILATFELFSSFVLAVVAIVVPLLAVAILFVFGFFAIRLWRRRGFFNSKYPIRL